VTTIIQHSTARKPPPSFVAIRHRLIAAKYRAAARDRGTPPRRLLAGLRGREIERFLIDQYGRQLPDDDAGRDDLQLAMTVIIAGRRDGEQWARAFSAVWAPWLGQAEIDGMLGDILAMPPWRLAEVLNAAALGRALGLTHAVRQRLRIRTIRAADVTAEQTAAMKRERDRQYQVIRRAEQRAARTAPLSRSKPWEAEGISRRTWERRRAAGGSERSESIESAKPWETAGVSRRTWFRRKADGRGTECDAKTVGHILSIPTDDVFRDTGGATIKRSRATKSRKRLGGKVGAPDREHRFQPTGGMVMKPSEEIQASPAYAVLSASAHRLLAVVLEEIAAADVGRVALSTSFLEQAGISAKSIDRWLPLLGALGLIEIRDNGRQAREFAASETWRSLDRDAAEAIAAAARAKIAQRTARRRPAASAVDAGGTDRLPEGIRRSTYPDMPWLQRGGDR
jgi:hypothetical protein